MSEGGPVICGEFSRLFVLADHQHLELWFARNYDGVAFLGFEGAVVLVGDNVVLGELVEGGELTLAAPQK